MKTRPIRAPQNIENCVYSIAYECGKSYIGETDRPWIVRLKETQAKFRSSGKIQSSATLQHAFGENHHIVWKEAKSLETEMNSMYRNYNEAACMICLKNSIS